MRILIAEDDEVSLLALQAMLTRRGHTVITASDGVEAWQVLQGKDPPPLAILDWLMPGMDGVEVCRRVRATPRLAAQYMILLTARVGRQDLLEGLRAGADDYIAKPFDPEELEARVNVGVRVVRLQEQLQFRVSELETALATVNQLQGLLPICCYCKSIRDDQNYWQKVENYIGQHAEVEFSHGICPDCLVNVMTTHGLS